MILLTLLVVGPKHLHTLLGHVARAKAQFDEASRGFRSLLAAELDATHQASQAEPSHELLGNPVVKAPRADSADSFSPT